MATKKSSAKKKSAAATAAPAKKSNKSTAVKTSTTTSKKKSRTTKTRREEEALLAAATTPLDEEITPSPKQRVTPHTIVNSIEENEKPKATPTEAQLRYATLLDIGMKIGFIILTGSFLIYIFDLIAPAVALNDLPRYWSLPLREYIAATGAPSGAEWYRHLGKSDFLNFVGIVILSGITIICYIRIIPIYLRQKDRVYAGIALLEVVILLGAASGFITAGH